MGEIITAIINIVFTGLESEAVLDIVTQNKDSFSFFYHQTFSSSHDGYREVNITNKGIVDILKLGESHSHGQEVQAVSLIRLVYASAAKCMGTGFSLSSHT